MAKKFYMNLGFGNVCIWLQVTETQFQFKLVAFTHKNLGDSGLLALSAAQRLEFAMLWVFTWCTSPQGHKTAAAALEERAFRETGS